MFKLKSWLGVSSCEIVGSILRQKSYPAEQKFSLSNSFSFRVAMVDGQGDLEDQLAEVKKKSAEIADRKEDLRIIEDLGAQMEEALILDNK